MARLHALVGEHLADVDAGTDGDPAASQVAVGIETDRGPWVRALVAAGYRVFAVNPLQSSRFRQRHSVSGAKSDAADAHTLADMVRTDSHQLRQVAGDSELAEAIMVVARAHKTLIWERTRHVQRLRQALQDFFPAALEAFEDLTAPDALELLGKAADPESAARPSRSCRTPGRLCRLLTIWVRGCERGRAARRATTVRHPVNTVFVRPHCPELESRYFRHPKGQTSKVTPIDISDLQHYVSGHQYRPQPDRSRSTKVDCDGPS
jgi:hypothetical protein